METSSPPVTVELVQAVAGRLLVLVAAPPGYAPAAMGVRAGTAASSTLPVLSVVAAGEGRVLLILDLDRLAGLSLYGASLRLDLPGASAVEASLSPVGIDAGGVAAADAERIALAALAGAWTPPVAASLAWRLAGHPVSGAEGRAGLDRAAAVGLGAAAIGWTATDAPLLLLSDGLESACRTDRVARWPVAGGEGARKGFAAALPLFRPGDRGLLLFEEVGDDVRFLGRLSWDEDDGAEAALAAVTRALAPPDASARAVLAPLVAPRSARPPAVRAVTVCDPLVPPALVAVAAVDRLLGLRALLREPGALPPDAVLVAATTDPSLAGEVAAFARLPDPRAAARPALVLAVDRACSVGEAWNLGANAAADAGLLLFLAPGAAVAGDLPSDAGEAVRWGEHALLVPAAAFRAAGGFDTGYAAGHWVADLCRRLAAGGTPCRFGPAGIVTEGARVLDRAPGPRDRLVRRLDRLRFAERPGGA